MKQMSSRENCLTLIPPIITQLGKKTLFDVVNTNVVQVVEIASNIHQYIVSVGV
jgi:hypothetical protein